MLAGVRSAVWSEICSSPLATFLPFLRCPVTCARKFVSFSLCSLLRTVVVSLFELGNAIEAVAALILDLSRTIQALLVPGSGDIQLQVAAAVIRSQPPSSYHGCRSFQAPINCTTPSGTLHTFQLRLCRRIALGASSRTRYSLQHINFRQTIVGLQQCA